MKTQIIALAAHDDLVSVRDRMTWAKTPRILLVWPIFGKAVLRPVDLRILQQHAAKLGAQMGIVTRNADVRHDAQAFGIPVFGSSADAQRGAWSNRPSRAWRVRRGFAKLAQAKAQRESVSHRTKDLTSPGWRIVIFGAAVAAVLSIATLFVPRATVKLHPLSMQQAVEIPLQLRLTGQGGTLSGGITVHSHQVRVRSSDSISVQTTASLPTSRAIGVVRFHNLTGVLQQIPAGTVVYTGLPTTIRFATLESATLDARTDAAVDVDVEALDSGAIGNVPANSIRNVEGVLSASVDLGNPAPTTGGADLRQQVPSQEDREQLRLKLLQNMQTEAEAELRKQAGEELMLIPGSVALASVDEELFDPDLGRPATMLTLTLVSTYQALFADAEEVESLAEATLDSTRTPGFVGRDGTLKVSITGQRTNEASKDALVKLNAQRELMRDIDAQMVNTLVRGRSPAQVVTDLSAQLPLSALPEVRLAPAWWPWLPLIPFRIDVVLE